MSCGRRFRQDVSAYAALIATPGDLAAGFELPANGELYVSTSGAVVATTKLLDSGTREMGVGPSSAGQARHIGRHERGVHVVKNAGAPGTVKLFLRAGLGVLKQIGEG